MQNHRTPEDGCPYDKIVNNNLAAVTRGEYLASIVKTTGLAGGLHWPYKGLIQPRLKAYE